MYIFRSGINRLPKKNEQQLKVIRYLSFNCTILLNCAVIDPVKCLVTLISVKSAVQMDSKCLICDEKFPDKSSTGGGSNPSRFKRSRGSLENSGVHLISDAKSKFALTSSQYTILQKVLSLPAGICKTELINGPYCRDCFTNINNVCHCMSALENLQQSVQEFRKDFGSKMKASFDGCKTSDVLTGSRKRKSPIGVRLGAGDVDGFENIRQTILDYLKNGSFSLENLSSKAFSKPRHIHEIISKINPDGAPDTKVDAELIVRTTNGDMPTTSSSRRSGSSRPVSKRISNNGDGNKSNDLEKNASGNGKKKPCSFPGCGISFYKESSLLQHLQLHRQETTKKKVSYTCWYCKTSFSTNDELRRHAQTSHKGSKECPTCKKRFKRGSDLSRHINAYHPNANNEVTTRIPCDACPKTFSHKRSLTKHYAKFHKNKKLFPKNTVTNKNKIFRPGRCKICSRIVTDVQSHMKMAHPGESSSSNNKSNKDKSSDTSTVVTSNVSVIKSRPGPASWKKKVENNEKTVSEVAEKPLNENDKTNADLLESTTTDDKPAALIPSTKSDLMKKTEHDDIDNGSGENSSAGIRNSQSTTKGNNGTSDSNPKPASIFKVAPFPFTTAPPQPQAKKYQFKNLLKIGDIN